MIEAGADVVTGHGPHVLRGIEIHRDKPILYSLGNFVFWQEPELFYRKTGFMAELSLRDGRIVGLRLIPYLITPSGLRLMPDEEQPSFLDAVRRATD